MMRVAKRYCECGRAILTRKSGYFRRYRRADDAHDLCTRCWEALCDRMKAEMGELLRKEYRRGVRADG